MMDRFSMEELESMDRAYKVMNVFVGFSETDKEMHSMIKSRLESRRWKTV